MAFTSNKDEACSQPSITHTRGTAVSLPQPQLTASQALTASQWPLQPTPGHWDPCGTENLEVPDPKANRNWDNSEALEGSAWVFSWWVLCPAATAYLLMTNHPSSMCSLL